MGNGVSCGEGGGEQGISAHTAAFWAGTQAAADPPALQPLQRGPLIVQCETAVGLALHVSRNRLTWRSSAGLPQGTPAGAGKQRGPEEVGAETWGSGWEAIFLSCLPGEEKGLLTLKANGTDAG